MCACTETIRNDLICTQYNIITTRRRQINKRYDFTIFKALLCTHILLLGWETISLRIHGRDGAVVLPRSR